MWAKDVGCSTFSSSFRLTGSQMWWQELQQYFWILRPSHVEEGAWSFMIMELPTSLWCLHRLLHEKEITTVIWGSLCGRSRTYLLLRSPHLRDEKKPHAWRVQGKGVAERGNLIGKNCEVNPKENQMVLKGKTARRGWCDVKWSRQGTSEHAWLCHKIGAHPWVIELRSSVSVSVKWD